MAKIAQKESEKARTELSDMLFADNFTSAELRILTRRAQSLAEQHGETFNRAGLCAIRDACNVLLWQGSEADLLADSEHSKKLRAELEAKLSK